jgi:hypothetical protein
MKPSRCFIGGFSSSKRIFIASQTWKLPIGIFVNWKVLRHSMRRFYNGLSAEFENSYTLLDVYNIYEKLELAYAHYEANIMRLPSCSRPQPPTVVPTKSSHSSSRVKAMHSATPILLSYNYYGNLAHKANECDILSEDFFCDYCGRKGHQEVVYFAKFTERKQLRFPWQNLLTSST